MSATLDRSPAGGAIVAPEPIPSRADATRPRLLVVDDQPANIQVLYAALSPIYQVFMATGGERALAFCRATPPDLILLDVVMPQPDGHAVCRALKADARTRGIPVIFVTAQRDPHEEALGLELGAVDFITKPISPPVVQARVKNQLALSRSTAALEELNATLEARVIERTRELNDARVAADAANRAKSDFLSNMSHEIRTPMNSVLGMTQLALRAEPQPLVRGRLEKIAASGRHLLAIINDILDFSKIEAGRLELEEADFRLADVLHDLLDQMEERARHKGLDLVLDVEDALSRPFRGDALRLRQVLMNYVGNAIKFSSRGSVTVRVRQSAREADHSLLRFEVHDEGIGVTAAQAAQLFQSFHQADASTTRHFGGTGLGLAICKQLASLMGGEVGVDSRPGAGSVFWFTARLRWGSGIEPTPSADESPSDLGAIAGGRILVVDDNAFNQEVAGEMLTSVGAEVAFADNGQHALDLLAASRFDLVLMDMQMPVMDGLEATRRVRADPSLAAMRVVGLTANARREDLERCRAAGMDDVLTKPVVPRQLYAVVARWMPGGQRGRPAAAREPAAPEVALATVAARDPEVIDLSILESNVPGRPERIRKFALRFVDTMSTTQEEIDAALAAGDLKRLAELGHRAKSAAATVGAMRLAGLCRALERFRAGGCEREAREIVEQMPPLLQRIRAEVAKALAAPMPIDTPALSTIDGT